jgi:hypothetical protein
MSDSPKQEIITFKVDEALRAALDRVPNRSQFIRSAVLRALEGTCPLCQGTGQLTLEQLRHWQRFAETHRLTECDDCHATHLVCRASDEGTEHTSEEPAS